MPDHGGLTGPAAARSALRKAREEQAARIMSIPSIHLLIYPTPDCMRISLVIYYSRPGMRRTCRVLREAQWRPREVSEQKLIEWAHRALAEWLETETLPEMEEDLRKGW